MDMAHRLVSYLYTGTYLAESDEPLVVHAHMFAIGDKYLIPRLKTSAVTKYANCLSSDDMGAFFRSLAHVFNLTPDSERALREEAIAFARRHLLGTKPSPSVAEEFSAVYNEAPTFSMELLKSCLEGHQVVDMPDLGRCYSCSGGDIVPVEIYGRTCLECHSNASSIRDI